MTSPFIKFKNASKETIDASDELVEEIRRAVMQAGQRLSRHIKREHKAADLERKIQHIEKFGPILVQGLAKIVGAPKTRVKKAEDGLTKLLGRDTDEAESALAHAETKLADLKQKQKKKLGIHREEAEGEIEDLGEASEQLELMEAKTPSKKKPTRKIKKKAAKKKKLKKQSPKKKTKARAKK